MELCSIFLIQLPFAMHIPFHILHIIHSVGRETASNTFPCGHMLDTNTQLHNYHIVVGTAEQ